MRFNTALLHKNNGPDRATGATHTPIYQSSAFEHKTAEELEAIFNNRAPGFSYTRINNPTVEAFERRVAALEGGIGAVACASGMAAISLSVLNLLSAGDEILSAAGIFGGTIGLFRDLESYGITTRYVADSTPESFENQITGRTKLIFVETIGNPKLDVPDISALSEMAHRHKIPVIVDNTAATPFLVRPIELGADIVVHSVSKYINGSGNSIGGIIVDSGNFNWDPERYPAIAKFVRFGEFAYLSKLRGGLFRNTGSCFSPFNAFLCSLGHPDGAPLRQCPEACATAFGQSQVSVRQLSGAGNQPVAPNGPAAVFRRLRGDIDPAGRYEGKRFFHHQSFEIRVQYCKYRRP